MTLVAPVALAAALVACTGASAPMLPYKVEVVQGNVITREMAQPLRAGLSREQVRALLGSPLLTDAFHADRWDYVFTLRRRGVDAQQRRVSVWFDGERVARFEADELPSEQEFVAAIDPDRAAAKAPVLELSEAQLAALPRAAATPASATPASAAASAPARTYPPLEPATR
jgi:outer membrane protein assembly factor BamE